jgi:autotransporter-associated beta strand protein
MKLKPRPLFAGARIATLGLVAFGTLVPAAAAEFGTSDVFKANNTLDLTTSGSWIGGTVPGYSDVAVWDSTVVGANVVTLADYAGWSGLRITNPGGPVTINGAGQLLELSAGNSSGIGIDLSAATQNLTINAPITLGSGGGLQEWNIGPGRIAAVGHVNGWNQNLTKTGAGTLRLAGTMQIYTLFVSQGRVETTATGLLNVSDGVSLGDLGGPGASGPTLALGRSQTIPSLTVQPNTSGATLELASVTTGTVSLGLTVLMSPLTISRPATASSPVTLAITSPFVGGTEPGTDALRFAALNPTVPTNWMSNSRNDFTGNVRIASGRWNFQAVAPTANLIIPDSSLLTIDLAAQVFWASFQTNETLDGLAGRGTMNVGVSGVSLTLNANNPANDGARVFAGLMPGGGLASLRLGGTGTQEFAGSGISFAGATYLDDGRLKLNATTNWASNVTIGGGAAPVLELHAAQDVSWNFNRSISGGSPNARIEKTGPGTVNLMGNVSQFVGDPTGALTVAGGRLRLNSLAPDLAVRVAGGAVFGGSGIVGEVTVGSGGQIEGGNAGLGGLEVASLEFQGAGSLRCTPTGGPVPVTVLGTLLAGGGPGSIMVKPESLPLETGIYPVLQYGDFAGSLGHFALAGPSRTLALQQTDNVIELAVDYSTQAVWVGNSAIWSANSLPVKNWITSTGGDATDFMYADDVVFDDSATGTSVQVSQTPVAPARITFYNDAKDYALGGTQDITSGSLIKDGAGKVVITGSFSFAGGATLNAGTVEVSSETGLGTGTRTFNGGTLAYSSGTLAEWTRATMVNAAGGTLDIGPGSGITHRGTLSGAGVLTKTGAGTLTLPYTTGINSAQLEVNAGVLKLDYGNGSVTYSGTISGGPNGVLQLVGTGATPTLGLKLTGNNTFTGETQIFGRRVFLDSATGNAIGGDIVIKNGNWPYHGLTINRNEQIADTAVLRFDDIATAYDFRLNGKTETLAGIETSGGGLTSAPNCIIENAGIDGSANDANGMAIGRLIVAGEGTHFFHGLLRDQNNPSGTNRLGFTQSGTGTQVLIGTGITYTSTTAVNSGKLVLRDATAFASASVTLAGGSLELEATSGNWTFGQPIGGGAGDLVKSGAGTVTLTTAATHTGKTIVNGGVLALGGGGSLGSTIGVELNGGSFSVSALPSGYQVSALLGTGSVTGSVTVSSRLAIGNSAGTMAFQHLTLGLGATAEFEVTGGGTAADLANVSGQLNLNGASLSLIQLGTFTPDQKYTLFAYTFGNLLGTFSGLADQAEFTAAGGRWRIAYQDPAAGLNGGTGNRFVTVTAIPEPATAAMLALALAAMLRRRARCGRHPATSSLDGLATPSATPTRCPFS